MASRDRSSDAPADQVSNFGRHHDTLRRLTLLENAHLQGVDGEHFDRLVARFEDGLDESSPLAQRHGHLPRAMRAAGRFTADDLKGAAEDYRNAIGELERKRQQHGPGSRDIRFLTDSLALVHCNLGEVLQNDGDLEGAERSFEAALRLQPTWGYILEKAAQFHQNSGRYTETEAIFRELAHSDSDGFRHASLVVRLASLHDTRARSLRSQKRLDEATAQLKRDIESGRIAYETWSPVIDGRGHTGDVEREAKLWKRSILSWQAGLCYLLAEMQAEQDRLEESVQAYRLAAKLYRASANAVQEKEKQNGDIDATGRNLLAWASSAVSRAGQHLVQQGSLADAVSCYDEALSLERAGGNGTLTPSTPGQARRWAEMAALVAAFRPDCLQRLDEALEMLRGFAGQEVNPFWDLYSYLSPHLDRPGVRGPFKAWLHAHLRRGISDRQQRRNAVDILRICCQTSGTLVTDDHTPQGQESPPTPWVALVPPVSVDLHETWVDRFGNFLTLFEQLQFAERVDLMMRSGMDAPAVYPRRANTGPASSYTIRFRDVQKGEGEVPDTGLVALAEEWRLLELGVEPIERVPLSWTTQSAHVVRPDDADTLRVESISVLRPLDVVKQHIETLLIPRLARFVDHQAVRDLLPRRGLFPDDDPERLAELEAREHISVLTSVLRRLVAERVYLEPISVVHTIVLKGIEQGAPPYAIVDQVRRSPEVKPGLWGNSGSYYLVRLGPRGTQLLQSHLTRQCVALPAGDGHRLLTAIGRVAAWGMPVGLVVSSQSLRGAARSLIANSFPDVPVLADEELVRGLFTRDTVDVDEVKIDV